MLRKKLNRFACRATMAYIVAGGAWIYLSDKLLEWLAPDRASLVQLAVGKGLLFVLVSASILFALINRGVNEISRSRDYYLKILDDFPSLIWRAGTDARCDYFNNTWLSFTGRPLAREIGDGWAEGVHPDDLDRCVATYLDAFGSVQPFTMEYRLRRHDGEFRWIVDHGRPFYDLGGEFAGYIGSCYDITGQKNAEESVVRSERRFRELIENTSDWIWEVDDQFHYVYASRKVSDMLGYEPAEVIGKTPFDLMPPEEAARITPALADLARNPQPFHGLENVNLHKSGSRVVLETSGVPIFDGNGRWAGLRGIDRDITARKESQEKIAALHADLVRHAAALEAANRELESFNYTVSHDLRTPLASISMACQILQDIYHGKDDPVCANILAEICRATERMHALISSLLNFSNLSRGGAVKKEPVDLTDMVKRLAAELRLKEPERRATFSIAEGVTAWGDPALLYAVLANLMGNAWKFTSTREETVIEFGSADRQGDPCYFVRDNGIGFEASQAEGLFEAFQRLPETREYEGFGIGLATARRIIERHGGKVWAEGDVGRGATFSFTLGPKPEQARGREAT